MASINFLGSYSGIDQSSIDQLMQVERLPLVQLANKKTSITEKQNAWKDINTRLNSLFEKLKALQKSETFTSKTSTSTDEKTVSMVASKNAIEGTYTIHVQQLATNTNIVSGIVPSLNGDITEALDIEGNFTIQNADGKKVNISISKGDNLKDIVAKINETATEITAENGEKEPGTGITASIIDGRIILSDNKTGARPITLTSGGNGVLTALGLNKDARTVTEGKNAIFTINGVEVTRTTNSISDVVEYTTINLSKVHEEGKYETIKVSQDTSKLSKAIQDFVDQYNSTMTFISDKLAAGSPEVAGSRGVLAGDSSLQRLQTSLRNMVTSAISNSNTDIKDISQLGVSTIDKHGQLKFDSSKLTEALNKDPQNVMNFFTGKNSEGKEIGFAPKLNEFINSYITSDKGIIKGKSESFEKTLKDLNKQIDSFNARMVKKEAYYTKMFAALDTAMMQAESQMSWLEGQITAMNAQNGSRK